MKHPRTLREQALRDRWQDMVLCALFRPSLFLRRLGEGYYKKEIYIAYYAEKRRRG